MNANKKYKKQLDYIDKQHKFIILRTLHCGNYETEMNRSMILEKLNLIYESLCFSAGIKASKPYRKRNNKIMPRLWRFVLLKEHFRRTFLYKMRQN